MGQQATTEVREQVNGEVAKLDFVKLGLSKLEAVDFSTLTPEQQAAYVETLKGHLFGAANAGIVVLKNGTIWAGGKMIGSAAQAQPVAKLVPSDFKLTQKNVSTGGEIDLPGAKIESGFKKLEQALVGTCRLMLARFNGNGIHVIGQKGKGDEAVAIAVAPLKGGMA